VPSCVPDSSGSLGPNWSNYTGPQAPHVPTIFDELDAKGLSWKIYGGTATPGTKPGFTGDGWAFAICPTFAECLYGPQDKNLVANTQLATDASAGNLPAFSIITPTVSDSQHNQTSMSQGDNWIGQIVSELQSSPDWSSTVVFLAWDDCGCFYDHVNPLQYNSTWGMRVPMIIISPFAKPGYTDSKPTTFIGMLTYAEHVFGLPAMSTADASAYYYSGAFCYNPAVSGCQQAGTAPVRITSQRVRPLTKAQYAGELRAAKEDT
jgi:phospholipase C